MSCPICLETNTNINLMRCSHGICYSCLHNSPNDFNGCPICRQGGSINYQTFYPDTQDYSPQVITNWSNPNFHKIKGQLEDLTTEEKVWITSNWGSIKLLDNINDLEIGQNYIIIKDNNIFHGKFMINSRQNSEEFLFTDCQILDREGKYYKSSPPTRSINLISSSYLLYSIVTPPL